MKNLLLTLAFALCMSVTAIGIPVPDRLTPEIENSQLMDVIVIGSPEIGASVLDYAIAEKAFVFTESTQKENLFNADEESFVIESRTNMGLDFDDGLFDKDYIKIESIQEAAIKSTWKPYRMPNYNYRPSIKPPRIALNRS